MMFGQTVAHKAQAASITEYAASLTRSGVQVLTGGPGTFWTRHESGALVRRPTFHVGPPASGEVREVLWRGRAALANYLLEPDERHPANAWLYICTDHAYDLEKLRREVRKNVRRGLRELRITPLTAEQVLAHGTQAFCDTRRRNGLNDGTIEEFRRWFTGLAKLPEIVYLGAWKDDQLAAFANITEVDDWADIGCYSMDALLHYKPNDTLIYSALTYYLVEQKCRLVTGGVSSIQVESSIAGLHRFKTQLGFEPHPVHRAFVPHPLLRPLINPLTLWGLSTMLRLKPGDRRLKKALGVLAFMRREMSSLEIEESSSSNE